MRRREFIFWLAGAPIAVPHGVRAQQSRMPAVAYVGGASMEPDDPLQIAFRQGLNETGYADGRNIEIEYHSVDLTDDLRTLAANLVRRQVAVIYTTMTAVALAAKSVTATTPIVFTGASDPVLLGLVANLSNPGANVTGATVFSHLLGPKRLELLRELVPAASMVAMLVNPRNPNTAAEMEDMHSAARALGMRIVRLDVSSRADVDAAFASIQRARAEALVVAGDPLISSQRNRIIAFAAQSAIPAIYPFREHVAEGGLMSYGASFPDTSRLAGIYVGRILKGTRPAELPVLLPTTFKFVLNRKTAQALGIEIPGKLLALADEVIE